MTLLEFYRDQFLEIVNEFEKDWIRSTINQLGIGWEKRTREFIEIFRIEELEDQSTVLTYSIILPKRYKQYKINYSLQYFQSQYQISLLPHQDGLMLMISTSAESLNETVLGFLYRVRAELIDLIMISL